MRVAPAVFGLAVVLAGQPSAVAAQSVEPDTAATVAAYGWVRDTRGRAVEAADVLLVKAGYRVATDEDGFFALPGPIAADDTVRVSHLSYGDRDFPLAPQLGQGLRLEIELSAEAIELAGILVEVRPSLRMRQMADHRRRREVHSGLFMSAPRLQSRGLVPIGDLLGELPGVRVERKGPFDTPDFHFRGGRCFPRVWIDGREAFGGAGALALRELRSSDLEAIELYRGGEAPADLAGGCLTVVAWTRRGGG